MPRPSFHAWLLLLSLAYAHPAGAQKPTVPYPEWIVIGFGMATAEQVPGVRDSEAINLNTSYSFERGRAAYQVALDYISPFTLGGRPRYETATISAGVGRRSAGTYHLAAQFIGPALVYHQHTTEDAEFNPVVTRSISPGLAASAQFYIKPLGFVLPEIGIGVELFGNLNYVQSYYGLRFAMLFNNTR